MIVFRLAAWGLPVGAQDSAPPLGIEEYLARETIGSPVLSPDGQMVAFTIGTKAEWDGNRNTNIWMIAADGGDAIQLTNSAGSDWAPQWCPDGRSVAFLSSRAGLPQIFVISTGGGEARQMSFAERGINRFCWIDGSSVAYVMSEARDPEVLNAEAEAGGGYEVGTTMTTSALWRQSIEVGTGAERLTDGGFYIDAFAAAPDGEHFALITADNSDLYHLITCPELRLIDRDGKTVRIEKPGRSLSDPEFSTDGRHFSVVASTIGLSPADGMFVGTVDRPGLTNITLDFDPTILSSQWVDGDNISFTSLQGTTCGVYAASVDGGPIRTLMEPELVMFSHSGPGPDGRLVFVASRGCDPEKLMVRRTSGESQTSTILYEPNPWIRERSLAATEVIRYPSFDGTEIEAVLTLPVGKMQSEGAPLVVFPHGGPDGMSLDDFSFIPQLFAQRGWMVFEPNFRGGIGYGREFYASNRGKIGEIDFKDIMSGVDYLVASGRADPSRLLVGGWSFGGTMSNWIIGHSNRFRAAVSVAGVADYVSRYGVSDINHGEAALWEFGRLLTDDIDFFVDSSPISHLEGCSTPMLLMHGEMDRRVPVGQAREMYRALREHGVEASLVLYPNAGHGINAPHQMRDLLRRWINWYETHLDAER